MLYKTQRAPCISGLQASLTEPSRIPLALIHIIIDKAGVEVANCSNIDTQMPPMLSSHRIGVSLKRCQRGPVTRVKG